MSHVAVGKRPQLVNLRAKFGSERATKAIQTAARAVLHRLALG